MNHIHLIIFSNVLLYAYLIISNVNCSRCPVRNFRIIFIQFPSVIICHVKSTEHRRQLKLYSRRDKCSSTCSYTCSFTCSKMCRQWCLPGKHLTASTSSLKHVVPVRLTPFATPPSWRQLRHKCLPMAKANIWQLISGATSKFHVIVTVWQVLRLYIN